MNCRNPLFYLFFISFLSACDDSSSSKKGIFSLSASDAPADAQVVNIAFKQVVVKGSSGSYSFNVSNGDDDVETDDDESLRHIDLVTFQGLKSATLVTNESLPVGEYQLCIYMKNNEDPDNTMSSYVQEPEVDGGAIVGLTTPSEGRCGDGVGANDDDTGRLFINKKFTISEGENSYIAEFDLNKVLKEPTGQDTFWTLKPTGIELIKAGSIVGTISEELAAACGFVNLGDAVYLYSGNVDLIGMADFRNQEDYDSLAAPIDRAVVTANDLTGNYEYVFPAVYAGIYSLGYTCLADNDLANEINEPNQEAPEKGFEMHAAGQNIDIIVGNPTVVEDLVIAAPAPE